MHADDRPDTPRPDDQRPADEAAPGNDDQAGTSSAPGEGAPTAHPPADASRDRPPFADQELVDRITKAVFDDHHGVLVGGEWIFTCPNTQQHQNGDIHASHRWNEAKATHFCGPCGSQGGAVDLARLLGLDICTKHFRTTQRTKGPVLKNVSGSASRGGAAAPPLGLTVAEYIAPKQLTAQLMRDRGVGDTTYSGRPAVKIPYHDEAGVEVAIRYRVALEGKERFKWRKGDRPILYGLERLKEIRAGGAVILVEGESDAHTLW